MVYEYEYDEETQKMRINALYSIYGASIEDYDVVMAKTIDNLAELRKVVRIVFVDTREHEYDFRDCKLLLEIALAIDRITKSRVVSVANVATCEEHRPKRYAALQKIVGQLRYDPIEAYKLLLRELRHSRMNAKNDLQHAACYEHYLMRALQPLQNVLENCELIQIAMPDLAKHKNRSLYRKIFHPTIRPNFMYTRYVTLAPEGAELLERYHVRDTQVEIYKLPGKTRKLYHIIPPEFRLNEDEYSLLDKARKYIGQHEPREAELAEPEAVRENILRIGLDLLHDLQKQDGLELGEHRLRQLAEILTRYTAGLGILELLLHDENIQDIALNSPIGRFPIFLYHGVHQECETNLVPTREDADSWATRFRLLSGRPLDEANPVLDTEIEVVGGRARVSAITRTLSPEGLAFAFRRHRDKPWTLPLFIDNKMLDSFSAGLTWFIIDGARTLLVAGTRSSGKTSLLGALMVQIMPHVRIISVEDTLELPTVALRNLGYNIERLKSRSVITQIETEIAPEEALRTALRLGDSALIVGEVRSKEAIALYEAMRIGALANVVAGTIHGESAYGVFDRVINDLGVPLTSFKATDIIMIANMLRSPDGLHSFRRLIEFTEVRKHWKHDPVDEGGFVNLLEYSARDDMLKPTKTLLTGESMILNSIASRVRDWKGCWDAVWENILLRQNIFHTLITTAHERKRPDVLEAPFVIASNAQFHMASEEVKRETGALDNALIFERWLEWLKRSTHGEKIAAGL